MTKIKYRVVTDCFRGFEAQVWRWWWPFWTQMGSNGRPINTHHSLKEAINFIKNHNNVVWESKDLC